jgi:secondary thiamine-phosphate synthase enzyme
MKTLTIATTRKDEVVDITERVEACVWEAGKENGACLVFAAHTTCAVTTADLDPGTDLDLLQALRKVLPEGLRYRHPHDPTHTPDHILASVIGPSVVVPCVRGRLALGVWQRVILVELDGPRERIVQVVVW